MPQATRRWTRGGSGGLAAVTAVAVAATVVPEVAFVQLVVAAPAVVVATHYS